MGKNKKGKRYLITEENLNKGFQLVDKHPLFGEIYMHLHIRGKEMLGKETAAVVNKSGDIYVNRNYNLEPEQWAYVLAHCQLHLAFGHFDADKMPPQPVDNRLWNLACDMYIAKFLNDMKFGKPLSAENVTDYCGTVTDEIKIYEYLKENGMTGERQEFGTRAIHSMDMIGLEKPIVYEKGEFNGYMSEFADALAYSAAEAVSVSGGHGKLDEHEETKAERAKMWFVNHYPLLGSLASVFKIVEDTQVCMREEISIAAIDVCAREIYINPGAKLNNEEMKFVIAHELLHAGLSHHERCQGRDTYLWNVACDYVINGWLVEMQVGKIPQQGLLYDKAYNNWSAEAIYEELLKEIKKNYKLNTFRGYYQGDILDRGHRGDVDIASGMSLDEFCRNALAQGLEYHLTHHRGLLPAGMIEEIRALAMPPIPWDVKLADWFDCQFPPLEKRYTYARPSRRQGATPDIPRPSCVQREVDETSRTFGVIIDTSGSMSAKMIGKALGSIASYAASKDVAFARVVFCDAYAYDTGYLSVEDIAGRIEVKGRGGTKLQPAVDLLEHAADFPAMGPVLIITDGWIENNLRVKHEHAYLIPKGHRLPFKAKGEVFYFE